MAKRKSPKAGKKPAKKPRKQPAKKGAKKPASKGAKTPKLAGRHVLALGLMMSLPLLCMAVFVHVLGWKLHYWALEDWPPFVFGALVVGFLATHVIVDLLNKQTPKKALK